MQPCPRCDGLGRLRHVTIGPLNTDGFLCDECDALWLRRDDIGSVRPISDPVGHGGHDYRAYMVARVLDPLLDIEEVES
jgi:hypothetical protein